MNEPHLTRRSLLKKMAYGGLTLAAANLGRGCGPSLYDVYPDTPEDPIHKLTGQAGVQPNIVIINADDLGWGDLGCYGGRAINTAHIDHIAAQGVRFTDFYACDSVCSPSRAGLLTGRYPKRMNLHYPLMPENMPLGKSFKYSLRHIGAALGMLDVATEDGAHGLNPNEITIAEALKFRNYQTGMVGKWHLGDYSQNPVHNPIHHGFDFYFGVPHSNDMTPFPLYRNEEMLEEQVTDQTKLTRLYTEEAIRFIESSLGEPFFLYFAHTFPHRPLHASKNFKGRSAGGLFGDAVEEVDWSVGRILDTLEKHHLAEHTIVLFTSDNGPWYQGCPGSFRGRKGQSFEGGYRVPLVVRWPGRIPPGIICHEPAMNIDLFPTCLAAAGLAPPPDRIIDGKDITELLTEPGSRSPHEQLFFYHQGELEGIRAGQWKYIRSINHYTWPMPVNKKWGDMSPHTKGPLPLLFDLKKDPGESYNLMDTYPEMGKKFEAMMVKWEARMQENPVGIIAKK